MEVGFPLWDEDKSEEGARPATADGRPHWPGSAPTNVERVWVEETGQMKMGNCVLTVMHFGGQSDDGGSFLKNISNQNFGTSYCAPTPWRRSSGLATA
jgi:hypothetical protein